MKVYASGNGYAAAYESRRHSCSHCRPFGGGYFVFQQQDGTYLSPGVSGRREIAAPLCYRSIIELLAAVVKLSGAKLRFL